MNKLLMLPLKVFLGFSLAATFLCGLIYLTMQQTFRRSADMIPVSRAEDAASSLGARANAGRFEIRQGSTCQSLSPYLIYLNDRAQLIASTALLGGKSQHRPKECLTPRGKMGGFA